MLPVTRWNLLILTILQKRTENGIESIFEVQFSVEAGSANRWDSDRSDEGLNEATFRGQEYGFANWFNVYRFRGPLDEYETRC